MTVKEYALYQLHWIVRKCPWVQEIFLAAGITLNEMAERILAVYNFDNFEKLNAEQTAYYEQLLGIDSDPLIPLADRRAAVQAAWNGAQTPTLASIQSVCDGWEAGGIVVSYAPGVLTLNFNGGTGIPTNIDQLKRSVEAIAPAHLIINYAYKFLLIRDIHNVKTLTQMQAITLNNFAGG